MFLLGEKLSRKIIGDAFVDAEQHKKAVRSLTLAYLQDIKGMTYKFARKYLNSGRTSHQLPQKDTSHFDARALSHCYGDDGKSATMSINYAAVGKDSEVWDGETRQRLKALSTPIYVQSVEFQTQAAKLTEMMAAHLPLLKNLTAVRLYIGYEPDATLQTILKALPPKVSWLHIKGPSSYELERFPASRLTAACLDNLDLTRLLTKEIVFEGAQNFKETFAQKNYRGPTVIVK